MVFARFQIYNDVKPAIGSHHKYISNLEESIKLPNNTQEKTASILTIEIEKYLQIQSSHLFNRGGGGGISVGNRDLYHAETSQF